MSYIVTRTHTRPNTEVNWYTGSPIFTPEYAAWIGENWIDNGKLSFETVYSEDLLTMTVTITAQDEATWNDLIVQQQHIDFQEAKLAYNTENGIIQTTTYATI